VFRVVGPVAVRVIGIVIGVLIVGNVIYRYRSLPASPQQEQVTWALAAVALLAGAQWIGRPIQPLPLPVVPLDAVPIVFFMFVPALGMLLVVGALTCLVVALLSDELFRVEVALNRALVYSLLTLFVVGGYVLVVGYLSRIFQSSGSLWFSLVATGLVAVLFQSIRERVQRFVNHLLYGERDEPYAALARLGQRLEAAFEPSAILPSIVETVAKTLNLPYVAIALMEHGELSQKSEWRAQDAPPVMLDTSLLAIPLIYQNEPLGELRACPRRGETTLAEADRRLLADLAQQASIAVHGARFMNDLRRLTAELQYSREHLVLAREEERRRLRRNLHDDLAPMLAGLALTATTIADLIPADPAKAIALASDLNNSMRTAVSDLRRLVYDLRPPTLDELGLVAAIR
jgi:signal transduction histidine kinase